MFQTIETERCADVFYGFLFDATVKNNVFQNTSEILRKEIKEKSNRLTYAFNQIENSNNSVLQHTLICFAMVQNENVFHYIVNHYQGKRKKQVEDFIKNNIADKTKKLLNGEYRSIVEFIDDTRAAIAIELGFE